MINIYQNHSYQNSNQESHRPFYKSRGERGIADYLSNRNIKFTYERPTFVIDKGQPKILCPDVSLDEYKIIMDYVGVKEDPKYHYSCFYKGQVYAKNSLDYLVLTPEHLKNGWKDYLTDSIGQILKDRYYSFEKEMKSEVPNGL